MMCCSSLAIRKSWKMPLNIPLISAAMDTVTEARLAIALAPGGRAGYHPPQPVAQGPGRRGR